MLNAGRNQYTRPTYSTKVCFMVVTAAGDITTSINKGMRAGPYSGLLLLDVYGSTLLFKNFGAGLDVSVLDF